MGRNPSRTHADELKDGTTGIRPSASASRRPLLNGHPAQGSAQPCRTSVWYNDQYTTVPPIEWLWADLLAEEIRAGLRSPSFWGCRHPKSGTEYQHTSNEVREQACWPNYLGPCPCTCDGMTSPERSDPYLQSPEIDIYQPATPSSRITSGGDSAGRNITNKSVPSFRVRRSDFYRVGRVFVVLWSEPSERESNDMMTPNIIVGHDGQAVKSNVRRFVVVREGSNYCVTLPISTYGGLGTGRRNVRKSEHGIIYTGPTPPTPKSSEVAAPGESGLQQVRIHVNVDHTEEVLDPMSRVDFGRAYTVEHHCQVRSIGMVCSRSRQDLLVCHHDVWGMSLRWQQSVCPFSQSSVSTEESYLGYAWSRGSHREDFGDEEMGNSPSSFHEDGLSRRDWTYPAQSSSDADSSFFSLGMAVLTSVGLSNRQATELLAPEACQRLELLTTSMEQERQRQVTPSVGEVQLAVHTLQCRGFSREQALRILRAQLNESEIERCAGLGE